MGTELQPHGPSEAVVDAILEQLAEGKSLKTICAVEGMPDRRTVQRWMQSDDELGARIREARECGFCDFAEETLELVDACTDPIKARVLFDARRWYLGKLSNAFAEKPIAVDARVLVGNDDAFALVRQALDRAAGTLASSGTSTRLLAAESPAGPDDAAG